jgi:hypothetical protein
VARSRFQSGQQNANFSGLHLQLGINVLDNYLRPSAIIRGRKKVFSVPSMSSVVRILFAEIVLSRCFANAYECNLETTDSGTATGELRYSKPDEAPATSPIYQMELSAWRLATRFLDANSLW